MSDEAKTRETPKAVLVAEDVLKHLAEYRVCPRVYIRGPVNIDKLKPGDVQDNLDLLVPVCEVCALGACVLSKARMYDAVPVSSFTYSREKTIINMLRCDVEKHLADVFSFDQLCLIECAFEKSKSYGTRLMRSDGAAADAEAFGSRYESSRERLAAIMTNIVENDGIFKPPAV